MAGRKPLPTNVKMLKGTAQKSRLNVKEPKPKADKIKMPPGLSDNAKKCWRIVSKQLQDAQIMANPDVHALQLYCEAYARWVEANDMIKEQGLTVMTPNGYPVQSPYVGISNKAFDQMKSLLVEFGMTPSSRTKVQVNKPEGEKTDDPWADI